MTDQPVVLLDAWMAQCCLDQCKASNAEEPPLLRTALRAIASEEVVCVTREALHELRTALQFYANTKTEDGGLRARNALAGASV